MTNDKFTANDTIGCSMTTDKKQDEQMTIIGQFTAICHDADGNELWRDTFPNTVTTLGKNLLLDSTLAGSSYTTVGPYMGIIGAVSYTGVPVAGDTMASHATWTEAGNANAPTYSGTRKTCAWSAASAGVKALSAGLVFTFTGTGTAKGCFICTGTGALSTIDNTAGTLYSAGLFSGGDQPVVSTNTLTVSYSSTIS
jgi:hypothetical protein